MKKLINGIVEFRRNVRPGYRESFGRLATGQSPDALFIACSDSRVVPNIFASTDPGDLFVLRNMGNLVPCCDENGLSNSDESEAAAIEFSVVNLSVSNIIVCGHSECAAMRALVTDREKVGSPNLRNWLRHGDSALRDLRQGITLDPSLSEWNQLSQLNVLSQMKHVLSYPVVRKRFEEGSLRIHGWWFDIKKADVYAFEDEFNRFTLIDEVEAKRIIDKLEK